MTVLTLVTRAVTEPESLARCSDSESPARRALPIAFAGESIVTQAGSTVTGPHVRCHTAGRQGKFSATVAPAAWTLTLTQCSDHDSHASSARIPSQVPWKLGSLPEPAHLEPWVM